MRNYQPWKVRIFRLEIIFDFFSQILTFSFIKEIVALFIAHTQKMTEGNSFSLFTPRGCTPSLIMGGTPILPDGDTLFFPTGKPHYIPPLGLDGGAALRTG